MRRKQIGIILIILGILLILFSIILITYDNSKTNYEEKIYCLNSKEEVAIYLQRDYLTEEITKFEYSTFEGDEYIFKGYNIYSSDPDLYYVDQNTCKVKIVSKSVAPPIE